MDLSKFKVDTTTTEFRQLMLTISGICFFLSLLFFMFHIFGYGSKKDEEPNYLVNLDQIVNLKTIDGKSAEDVDVVLGDPISVDEIDNGSLRKYSYNDFLIEIYFNEDKPDYGFIKNIAQYPFSRETLQFLGLAVFKPSIEDKTLIQWINIDYISVIEITPDDHGDTHCIYVKF